MDPKILICANHFHYPIGFKFVLPCSKMDNRRNHYLQFLRHTSDSLCNFLVFDKKVVFVKAILIISWQIEAEFPDVIGELEISWGDVSVDALSDHGTHTGSLSKYVSHFGLTSSQSFCFLWCFKTAENWDLVSTFMPLELYVCYSLKLFNNSEENPFRFDGMQFGSTIDSW